MVVQAIFLLEAAIWAILSLQFLLHSKIMKSSYRQYVDNFTRLDEAEKTQPLGEDSKLELNLHPSALTIRPHVVNFQWVSDFRGKLVLSVIMLLSTLHIADIRQVGQ